METNFLGSLIKVILVMEAKAAIFQTLLISLWTTTTVLQKNYTSAVEGAMCFK